jgi:large conductance mechanosensitive channel
MLKDFKEFALKGNLVDMAVGIVLGAAFGTVIKSLVDDLLMPIVASLFNMPDFLNLFVRLKDPTTLPDGIASADAITSLAAFREAGGVALAYGSFINALIAFLLVAFALWMVVKGMLKMQKAKEEEEAPAPAGPSSEDLLGEIRDILKSQS